MHVEVCGGDQTTINYFFLTNIEKNVIKQFQEPSDYN